MTNAPVSPAYGNPHTVCARVSSKNTCPAFSVFPIFGPLYIVGGMFRQDRWIKGGFEPVRITPPRETLPRRGVWRPVAAWAISRRSSYGQGHPGDRVVQMLQTAFTRTTATEKQAPSNEQLSFSTSEESSFPNSKDGGNNSSSIEESMSGKGRPRKTSGAIFRRPTSSFCGCDTETVTARS